MSLPRPYIPLRTRVKVARRQWDALNPHFCFVSGFHQRSLRDQLRGYLYLLFGDQKRHLDHDPPLAARQRVRIVAGKREAVFYKPDANDPDYLIYRTVEDHKLKTNVRGDGAQYPDRVLIKRERRRLKKKRPKRKIANRKRKWPKRKLRGSKWR